VLVPSGARQGVSAFAVQPAPVDSSVFTRSVDELRSTSARSVLPSAAPPWPPPTSIGIHAAAFGLSNGRSGWGEIVAEDRVNFPEACGVSVYTS
jgi:hypothetical protein